MPAADDPDRCHANRLFFVHSTEDIITEL